MSTGSGDVGHAISLPQGGGAVRGIGETFEPNPFTGTGNFSVPIATSPGRNGFGPVLSLQYSSGNGNGPFGLGWSLAVPRVTRKTEHGLPRYDESDTFIVSGGDDLVRLLTRTTDPATGDEVWRPESPTHRDGHAIHRYRSRTDSLARIERWEHDVTGEAHWRATTTDGITNVYGRSSAACLSDPADPRRVYEWLLEETFDPFGNHVVYEYACDDPALYGDDPILQLPELFERNRVATQRYLRRIYYGNLPDGAEVGPLRRGRRYGFEVVFDYGDWAIPTESIHPEPPADGSEERFGHQADLREDRFSSFRSSFEVRTLRRCRRVLMFHHFAELGGPTLVRSTDFEYRTDPDSRMSLLVAARVSGYRKRGDGSYHTTPTPPTTFAYSELQLHQQRYQSIRAAGGDGPAMPIDDREITLVDLFGDGLPDVVQSTPAGWRYWRNLGGGVLDRPRSLTQIPSGVSLGSSGVGFADIDGDGHVDLLTMSGPLPSASRRASR